MVIFFFDSQDIIFYSSNMSTIIYGAPEWGRANGIAKSEKGSWCLRTGDWGFFDTSTVQVAGTGIKVSWAVNRKR